MCLCSVSIDISELESQSKKFHVKLWTRKVVCVFKGTGVYIFATVRKNSNCFH